MKKIVLSMFIAIAAMAGTVHTATAQVRVNINIGSQPQWGPAGYDYAQYYYLPDADAYYSVSERLFYFRRGNRWIGTTELPGRYRNMNLYNSYKVVVNDYQPWRNWYSHRQQYSRYRNNHSQIAIRDSRDSRYYASRGNGWNSNDRGRTNNGYGNNGGWHNNSNGDRNNRDGNINQRGDNRQPGPGYGGSRDPRSSSSGGRR